MSFTDGRLFHIARSKNRNLVCYDVNLQDGKLNTQDPLHIYWLNREDAPGKTNGLTYIQRKLAYGYKLVSGGEDACEIALTAYPHRTITVCKQGDRYICQLPINGEPAVLTSLYVAAHPNNSLKVEYVVLYGMRMDTEEEINETIIK